MKIVYDDGTEKDYDDMPVFPILAKDRYAAAAIQYYRDLLVSGGSYRQAAEVQDALVEVMTWQGVNRKLVKDPDHKHVPVGG